MRRIWWIAFIILDTLLLALFAAGYLARWIDPRTVWWPQLCAIGLPLLSVLVLTVPIVASFFRKWRLAGLHILPALLIVIRFVAFGNTTSPPANENAQLRILSYNLGQFDLISQAEQAQKLGKILHFLHPDVVGLQEFMVRYRGAPLRIKNMPYVANKLDSLGFQSVASDVHDVSTTFQPIASRASKIEQLQQRRLSIVEEGFPEMKLMRMHFRWNGREAVLYNLHLRTFGERKPWDEQNLSPLSFRFWIFYLRQYRDAFRYRAWQAEQIRNAMEQETLPLIVSGDFNSTPHNWVFHHLAQGMQDVFRQTGSTLKTSYHTRLPLARIDHMLVSRHWKIFSADIPPMEHSDHRPLLVQLGLNE